MVTQVAESHIVQLGEKKNVQWKTKDTSREQTYKREVGEKCNPSTSLWTGRSAICPNRKELAMYLNLITWVAKFTSMDLLVWSHFIKQFFTKPQITGHSTRVPQMSHPIKQTPFLENSRTALLNSIRQREGNNEMQLSASNELVQLDLKWRRSCFLHD